MRSGKNLSLMSIEQLVGRFGAIGVEQYQAELEGKIGSYNRLYDEMATLSEELRSRPGDQRRALAQLFLHDNSQVRLKAAIHALALMPDEAKRILQMISDRHEQPQADARGMLRAMAGGTYVPD